MQYRELGIPPAPDGAGLPPPEGGKSLLGEQGV
jgi:hypothetical protein